MSVESQITQWVAKLASHRYTRHVPLPSKTESSMHECTTTACQIIYQILTSPTELLFGYHRGKPRMIKEKEKKSF